MLKWPCAVRSFRQVDQCGQGFVNGLVGQHQRRRALAGCGVAGHFEQHALPFVHHGLNAATGGLQRFGRRRVRILERFGRRRVRIAQCLVREQYLLIHGLDIAIPALQPSDLRTGFRGQFSGFDVGGLDTAEMLDRACRIFQIRGQSVVARRRPAGHLDGRRLSGKRLLAR